MAKNGAGGLVVAGSAVDRQDPGWAERLSALSVPPAGRERGEAPDPVREAILTAMLAAPAPVAFEDAAALDQDVTMRREAIAVMTALNAGMIDGDYFDPGPAAVHPQIGTTHWNIAPIGGTGPGNGHWTNGPYWQVGDIGDPWCYEFDQRADARPSAVLDPVQPFRGECAGALQLCTFRGALAALGAPGFDAQHAETPLEIGPWSDAVRVYLQKIPLTDPKLPGDYFYFKNKNDYSTWAPNGFWQGLNCLYVGADQLGTARYSGLGASWQSETELRTTMGFAYAGDCYPHRVTDPETEIRFTVHARLVLGPPPAPAAPAPGAAPQPTGAPGRPTPDHLRGMGFVEKAAGVFVHPGLRLRELAQALSFGPAHMRQAISAPLSNPGQRVALDGAHCLIDYEDETAHRHDPDARVSAVINLGTAER